jgi:hypothetical protein
MALSEPKVITFWIAVALTLFGLIAYVVPIASVAPFAIWIVVIGFVVLALGNLIKGF